MPTDTEWIFAGAPRYSEFREEVGTDDDVGAIIYQAVQRRTVYQFRRYKLVKAEGESVNFGDGQLGEESFGAEITATQGSATISASIVLSDAKWICMSDDIEETDLALPCFRRVQTWEKRDEWDDYSWPVVT